MRWIIESSLKLRFLLIIIAAAIMFIGVTQLRDMPVDVLPEFAPPYVEVRTEALGLSAEEVEQLITVPLEQDLLNGVPWLKEIRSESIPGLSSVVMVFEPGTDIMLARQVVQERLTQSHGLPNVSKPPEMLQPLSSTSRVMMIGLTSEELSDIQMSVLSRWTIRPRLMGVPGLLLIVEKFPSANTLEVTRGVEEALNEVQPGLAGLEMDTTAFRPATFIESSIDNLTRALIIGSILVVVVLVAFLYSWRSALISAVAIPLSLITAALVLFLLGISMNTMVLAGLMVALGVIGHSAHNRGDKNRKRLR